MEKKHVISILGCLLLMSAILIALYASSPLAKELYRGSFDRRFTSNPILSMKAVLDLGYNSFYLAGAAKDKIYLGNLTAPFLIGITDTVLSALNPQKLEIPGLDSMKDLNRFKISINDPDFFLLHGTEPQILRGDMETWKAKPIMPDTGYYFVEAVPISSNSLALRSYSSLERSYELAKKTTDSPYFRFENRLLQKQIDGLFCVDGQLSYSKELKQLVYMYFYRNEFIVSDSNLNLIYKGHTIDTFRRARIKVADVGGNTSMLSTLPVQVNGKSCVFKKYLLVNSNILAQNEDSRRFESNVVIDAYDLTNGVYLSSFYIPHFKNKKPSDFLFSETHLIALYDSYIVLYEFRPTFELQPMEIF